MGFLSPEDEAIMWRGLMLLRGVQHFLEEVAWGDLDYLLVDMPPGTGDIQMGLARMLPRAEMLIVTTPALAAQKVAVRAADMARKGYLRVAGVIENMSGFTCDHGEHYDLFGSGGGERLAQRDRRAAAGPHPARAGGVGRRRPGRAGCPRGGGASRVFAGLVDAVLDVAPVVEMRGCTARHARRHRGGCGIQDRLTATVRAVPRCQPEAVRSDRQRRLESGGSDPLGELRGRPHLRVRREARSRPVPMATSRRPRADEPNRRGRWATGPDGRRTATRSRLPEWEQPPQPLRPACGPGSRGQGSLGPPRDPDRESCPAACSASPV